VHIWVLLEIDHILGAGESIATRLAIMSAIGFPLTALWAALSYRFVERPFLERKLRTTQHAPAEPPPVAFGPAR
jgi:peptidoglycan/LPS O-acetylase OafA/YrhL